MLVLGLIGVAAAADCPAGATTSAGVVDHAEQGVVAFAELDEDAFRTAMMQAGQAVPCLGETVLPDDAAALHRANGLLAFADGDEPGAMAAFRAALRLQPQYRLPSSFAPPESPLAGLYDTAAITPAPDLYLLPDTVEGQVHVDGSRALVAPEGLPSLVQVVRVDGSLFYSDIVAGPGELPVWFVEKPRSAPVDEPVAVAPVPVPLPEPTPVTVQGSSGARTGLVVGAVVAGIAAGGLYGASAMSRRGYETSPTAVGRQRTNTLYFGSVGLGVATLGFGVAAVALPGG